MLVRPEAGAQAILGKVTEPGEARLDVTLTLGPVRLIVNGPWPVTVTVMFSQEPGQSLAAGVIAQVGMGLTTKVAWQVVVQPNASVTVNS